MHGMSSHGFPNWFFIGVNQNGLSVNMTAMFDDQARHVAYIIDEVAKRGRRVAEVTPEAEAEWVAEIQRLAFANREFYEACTPRVLQQRGPPRRPEQGHHQPGPTRRGSMRSTPLLAEWREQGALAGFALR